MQNHVINILIFALAAALIFYRIPYKLRSKYLLTVSVIFYFVCDYRFLLLLLVETCCSYTISRYMVKKKEMKKPAFILGVILVVGVLAVFKYHGFFAVALSRMLAFDLGSVLAAFVMPLGISYYSFKIISYLADIYQEKIRPSESLEAYALYIMFFPQIICGPISRYSEISEGMQNNAGFQPTLFSEGILLIISGLYKKLVIADRLNGYVNTVFGSPESFTGLALLMAAFFYSIQIYCDFAGYSELMIGVMNLFGYRCKANFNCPYFSENIKEFWQRWHISLSAWLRDYIYIPLGGSRCSKSRKNFNLMATFLISGIWHGNRVNFLAWGIYHGILNCLTATRKKTESRFLRWAKIGITFILATIGWTIFRAGSMQELIHFYSCMVSRFTWDINAIQQAVLPFTYDYSCLSYFLCVAVSIFLLYVHESVSVRRELSCREKWWWNAVFMLFIVLLAQFGDSNFMYANF